MQQTALFHDSIYDAMGADVAACGGIKKVACTLWPTLEPGAAASRLRGGLNPEHAQKLCPEEVIAIKQMAKAAGSSATINYEARLLSFEINWIEPEDQHEKLQRLFIESAARIESLAKEIKRSQELVAQSQRLVRAVK